MFAVSSDGKTHFRSADPTTDWKMERGYVIGRCEELSGQKCFLIVNDTGDATDSVTELFGLLSDEEIFRGDWMACFQRYSKFKTDTPPSYFGSSTFEVDSERYGQA